VYSIQYYVIKFVSDLRQVDDFLRVLRFPPPNKTDRHDIIEILLNVALNTTTLHAAIVCTELLSIYKMHNNTAVFEFHWLQIF